MGIEIPLFEGLSLIIGGAQADRKTYPTARVQKGLILLDHGRNLAEEAVGFGVPMLQSGLQTIFPGSASLTRSRQASTWRIEVLYQMALVERISNAGSPSVENKFFYAVKNLLAAWIRRFPIFRGMLTAISSLLRRLFHWETIYTPAGFSLELKVLYTLDTETGRLCMEIDTSDLPTTITTVMLMNELGAHAFDRYMDSSGNILHGKQIGCWDEVTAPSAWFESRIHRVAFRLGQVENARLYRGRELVGSRLAWAGFGYSFPPSIGTFRCELTIEPRP
jgi:hypothetical protein